MDNKTKLFIIIGIVLFILWKSKAGQCFCHCINSWTEVQPDKVRFADRTTPEVLDFYGKKAI